MIAGSTCPIEIMKRVISEMHMRDVTYVDPALVISNVDLIHFHSICYGMTETSPVR